MNILKKIRSLFKRKEKPVDKARSRDPIESGILLISDLHVTDEATGQEWLDLAKRIAEKYDPEKWRIVVAGDIVDHGRASEFEHAIDGFAALVGYGFSLYMVPGNHDYGLWGNSYQSDAHARFLEFCDFVTGIDAFPHEIDCGDYQLLLLDSTAHNEIGEPFARGRIGDEQLVWLEVRLASPKPCFIVMHHRPYWTNRFLAVSDRADLQALVERRTKKGRIVKYLCGHRHEEDLARIAAGKFREIQCVIEVDPMTGRARSIAL